MKAKLPAPIGITQAEIERWQQLNSDAEEIDNQLEELREELIKKLQAGAPIQDGAWMVELKTYHPRRPEWKDAFIRLNGQAAADELIAATPEGETHSLHVHRRSRFVR